jgi:hypothetical protein
MEDNVWLEDSPVTLVEGEQIAFSVDWQGAATVAEPLVAVYKNHVDVTAAAMPGGDHVVNGSVLTMKKLHAAEDDGGARYVLVIEAVVDGNRERRKLLVQIVRASAES